MFASEPGGIFRRQKNSDRGDVPGLTDAAERGLGDGDLLEIRSDEAAAVGAFGLDYARTDGVDPDLLRAELAGQHAGDGVDRALSAGVNCAASRCDAADKGANFDDATPLSEVLHSGLRRKEEAQHVDVEVPVKVLLVDGLDGASSYTPELFTRMSSLLGPGGIMEQLTKRLYERVESNEMEKGYQIIRISEQEYRTTISREHKLFAFSTKSIELGSKHGTQNLRWSPAIF